MTKKQFFISVYYTKNERKNMQKKFVKKVKKIVDI